MPLAERQAADFERKLAIVIRRFQALILRNARSGYLFSMKAEDRIRFAPDLYEGLLDALRNSGYLSVVSELIEKDKDLIAEVRSLRSARGLPTEFSKTAKETLGALQRVEFQQFDNIGTNFINTLHSELMNFALTGVDESVFIDHIRASLDNKFKRYAFTYAETSRAKFIQQVQDEAARDYEGELYWVYFGPEDEKNRDACVEGLAKEYFTNDERIEFEMRTAEERAWNCRHTFEQITKEDYEENKH